MYTKPNISMVASAENMSQAADVTIYGKVCTISEYCEEVFSSIDDLLVHLVNHHDEMWEEDYLKNILINENLLEDLEEECDDELLEEGEYLECESCGKCYDS